MRTLNGHVERTFDQSHKDTNGCAGIWRGIDDGSCQVMSALNRITDPSQTSDHVRKVPNPEVTAKTKSRPKAASQFKPDDGGSGGH